MSSGQQRAVFLDRDGVLNRVVLREGKPYPPANREGLEILPGTAEALGRLKAAGFELYVVTNQPDVARGTQSRAAVEEMHAVMAEQLPLDGFYVCYHDDIDGCECRKPKPGMMRLAAAEHGLRLEASYLIGDRWRDVEAGQRAECRTVWLDFGYAERGPARPANATLHSLAEAVDWILGEEQTRHFRV